MNCKFIWACGRRVQDLLFRLWSLGRGLGCGWLSKIMALFWVPYILGAVL